MNWIKEKLKRFWRWLVVLILSGFAITQVVGFPPTEPISESGLLNRIAQEQADSKSQKGRYSQYPDLGTYDYPFEFTITRYVMPNGEDDYQVIFKREIHSSVSEETASGSGVFVVKPRVKKETKSFGYGPEAVNRTWDWR